MIRHLYLFFCIISDIFYISSWEFHILVDFIQMMDYTDLVLFRLHPEPFYEKEVHVHEVEETGKSPRCNCPVSEFLPGDGL